MSGSIRRVGLLVAALITGGASPADAVPWPICHHGQPADACVIDGDTIRWRGERIRLERTDAPEIDHAHCPAERAAGERARDRLAALLGLGADVVLSGREDRYRRPLGRIATPAGDAETIMLGERLTLPYRPGAAERDGRVRHWCGE